MNVLYLINFAGKAGTEKYVLNLMRLLAARGDVPHLAFNIAGPLSETAEKEGYPCLRLNMSVSGALSAARTLAKYCRENEIEVIHAQYPMENIIAVLSKLFCRVKVVYTSHLTIYQNAKWKILNRIFTPFDHRVIPVCRQGASILASNGVNKSRIQVIYNGVEPAGDRVYDRAFARSMGVSDDRFVMSIMARYSPEKGLPFLLASLAKLRRKTDKPFVCFIAGDGEDFDDFARMLESSRMNDCVLQLGFRRDSDAMLRSSDLYLNSSSKNEAMSFAILEALNAGVPCVVTDVGGNRDLAETNRVCGTVVPYGDSDAFSDAILELMENPYKLKTLSDAAIIKVREEFDLKKLADDVFDTYK